MALTNIISNLLAPVDPYAYNPDPNYVRETQQAEEERRRQLEEEQRRRAEAEQPVTQTIKYNPDGTQEMVIKGSPTALSADNPNTPTLMGPAVPRDLQANTNFSQPAPQLPQMSQPGPAVQVAGPTQVPETPVNPNAIPAATPAAAPAQQFTDTAPMPGQLYTQDAKFIDAFHAGQNDPRAMAAIYGSNETPEYLRMAARDQFQKQLRDQQTQKRTEQEVADAVASGNGSDFAKLLKRQGEDGSYVRAYLYSRLGLNDLAKAEQQKLGAGNIWQGVIGQKGERAIINYDGNGLPVTGYNEKGQQLTGDELAAFAAGASPAKGLTTHTQAFKDKTTGELYWQRSDGRIVNSQGGVYTGPTSNLFAYGIGSDTERQNILQLQKLQNELAYAPIKKRVEMIAEHEAKFGPLDPAVKQNLLNLPTGVPAGPTQVQGTVTQEGAVAPINTVPGATTTTTPAAQQNAVQVATSLGLPISSGVRDQARQQQLWDESVRAGRTGFTAQGNPIARPGTSAHQNANAVDMVLTPEQQRIAEANGFYRPYANDPNHYELRPVAPGGVPAAGQYPGQIAAAQQTGQAVGQAQQVEYQTKFVPALNEKAEQGSDIARVRKDQLEVLNRNPELVGLLNGQGSMADEARNIIRDSIAGQDNQELSRRLAALDLNQRQKDALYEYLALQNKILPLTLKQNAGAGSISEAEHKINRDAAVDATRIPIYTAYSAITRDQFDKSLKQAERDYATANRFTTEQQHSTAWSKQKKEYVDAYDRVYKARAEYIAKYGSTPQAVVAAYKIYPVPTYNPNIGRFEYLGESAKAARPPLSAFTR